MRLPKPHLGESDYLNWFRENAFQSTWVSLEAERIRDFSQQALMARLRVKLIDCRRQLHHLKHYTSNLHYQKPHTFLNGKCQVTNLQWLVSGAMKSIMKLQQSPELRMILSIMTKTKWWLWTIYRVSLEKIYFSLQRCGSQWLCDIFFNCCTHNSI